MCRKPNILATIKVRTQEWAGHLVRMPDDSAVKKYFWGNKLEEGKQKDKNLSGQTALTMSGTVGVERGKKKKAKDSSA